jgi:drug/metabolite transporter (DMT)-like permease
VIPNFFSHHQGELAARTAAGIAQTIGATSPLFVLVLDRWRGEKIGWRSLGYGVLSIGGVSLLFYP